MSLKRMCISNYDTPVFVDDVLGDNVLDIVCIYILCVVIIQIFKPLIKAVTRATSLFVVFHLLKSN